MSSTPERCPPIVSLLSQCTIERVALEPRLKQISGTQTQNMPIIHCIATPGLSLLQLRCLTVMEPLLPVRASPAQLYMHAVVDWRLLPRHARHRPECNPCAANGHNLKRPGLVDTQCTTTTSNWHKAHEAESYIGHSLCGNAMEGLLRQNLHVA